jgi:hypothetical protein
MLSASKSGSGLATGYNLTRSLRFRASASAYLNRTFTTPTSSTIYTWSSWVKRGTLSTTQYLFGASTTTNFGFNSSNNLIVTLNGTTAATTTAVYRDPSSWYHVVYVQNGSAQTIYVNNISVATGTTANTVFNTAIAHQLAAANTTNYFDGYLTEVNFIDGQALTPSSFGSTNALTGVWQPAAYTGTYGTNGFYLPFTDNSALTTASNVGLGKDFSGNGNYWVTNNISITAGVTYDSMTDVPTLTSATAANFAVLNPLNAETGMTGTLAGGNLNISGSGGKRSTIAARTGKFYWEFVSNSGAASNFPISGLYVAGLGTYWPGYDANSFGYFQGGDIYYNGSSVLTVSSFTDGDLLGFAWDADTGKVWVAKNNTWQNSGNPAAGTGQVTTISTGVDRVVGAYSSSGSSTINFGQRPFTYTPPTGFVALNTYNLPTSTILKGNSVMDATLYTGTLLSNAITNAAAFKPDLVWLKSRSAATDHKWTDSVRGVTKALASNSTNAETTDVQGLTAFNTNGFTVGTNTDYNNLAATYVAWQWQAGQGSSASNTNGTITSTVSVNASAGFSVVTFATPGGYTTGTVGHGLGVAPAFYIVKNTNGSPINWNTYHQSIGNTAALYLSGTQGSQVSSSFWNNTSPTSSVFSIGANLYASANHVAYCWTPIAGYSAFGSYTGNGSTDGPFVYTGFRPKWLMVKRTDSTSDWYIWDTARDTYNVVTNTLLADTSGAETSATSIDDLSNGFKCRSATVVNASGGTYIYATFAENPFKNSLAR